MTCYRLDHLDDSTLLSGLTRLAREDCQLTAQLLAHIGEVDRRRLYLEAACSSMFVYCQKTLGMDDGVAYRRIHAARAARKFPVLFERVAAGDIDAYIRESRNDGPSDVTWDHFPGGLIAKEAGCRLRRFDGADLDFRPEWTIDFSGGLLCYRERKDGLLESVLSRLLEPSRV